MNIMDLNAKLAISRTHCNLTDDFVSITVVDGLSRCEFLSLEISMEDFAKAITGQGYVACKGRYCPEAPVGKTREVKTERVMPPENYPSHEDYDVAAAPILAPYEVDGWVGRPSDLFNHHKRGDDGRHAVAFVRYVDTKAPAAPATRGKGRKR